MQQAFNRYLDLVSRGEPSVKAFEQAFPSLPVGRVDSVIAAYSHEGRYKSLTTPKCPRYSGPRRPRDDRRPRSMRNGRRSASRGWPERSWIQSRAGRALQADPAHPLALKLSGQGDPSGATTTHPDDARAWLLRSSRGGRRPGSAGAACTDRAGRPGGAGGARSLESEGGRGRRWDLACLRAVPVRNPADPTCCSISRDC